MLIVQKFGGSSLATNERIMNVAKRVANSYDSGNSIVVVLSAIGKTTNNLIDRAMSINKSCSKRELDMLLSTGEQQSCALMAMALHSLGYPAVSLNASQVSILSSSDFGNARIQNIQTNRIKSEIEKRNIVIITGFQGIDKNNEITTLGRGGSDTTAVAIACVLGANACEIYTDVDGVYTADPNLIENSIKLKEINYDEMLELTSLGAKVLHNRSVEIAKKYNLNIVVKSSLNNEEGTIIKEKANMEKMLISGVATDRDVAKITIHGLKDIPGLAFKIFSLISKRNIVVDIIVQSTLNEDSNDISFTVQKKDLKETISILEKNKDYLEYRDLTYTNNLVKLSIVGAGLASSPGLATAMFEALYDAHVNIQVISTSEIKISVLIDEDKEKIAAKSVHEKLIERSMG
ncbi:MAG: aspartate kinase [Defluviitaleaceae bacterium]|nr:aspartate kinase [Defluviitaleaceae bacterium]